MEPTPGVEATTEVVPSISPVNLQVLWVSAVLGSSHTHSCLTLGKFLHLSEPLKRAGDGTYLRRT